MIPGLKAIGFIGGGNMAEALIRGARAADAVPAESIVVFDVSKERCEKLRRELGVTIAPDNRTLVSRVNVVMLAVKPQMLTTALSEVARTARPDQLWLSILAGVTADRLEKGLGHANCMFPRVIRAMPNTPALMQAGASGLCAGGNATSEDIALARALFETVGKVEIFEAGQMDAFTAVTGSGPAYVFRLIEVLIDAGVAQGLPREKIEPLVKQMVYGSGLMARDSAEPPEELRRRVTSPKGVTAEGLAVMEARDFPKMIAETVEAAVRRSKELGKES